MNEIKRTRPRGGICGYCQRETGGLVLHERYCLQRDDQEMASAMDNFLTRAGSFARAYSQTRPAQRWLRGVRDEDVAGVLYAIEAEGLQAWRSQESGAWVPTLVTTMSVRYFSTTVNEMIRTGLLTYRSGWTGDVETCRLIPARVHLADPMDPRWSACRFPMESVGPMRVRLVKDMVLVDCLECEAAIARGGPRGL